MQWNQPLCENFIRSACTESVRVHKRGVLKLSKRQALYAKQPKGGFQIPRECAITSDAQTSESQHYVAKLRFYKNLNNIIKII